MANNIRIRVAVLSGVLLASTGCASTMTSMGADTVTKQGCLIGAGTGAALGAVAGSQMSDNATQGALIGAVIGGAVGYFGGCQYGQIIEARRSNYETEAAFHEGQIQLASAKADELDAQNATLQQDIDTTKAVIARLEGEALSEEQRVELAQETLNTNRKALSEYSESKRAAEQEVELQETLLAEIEQQDGTSETAQLLKAEIDEMKTANAELTSKIEVMTAQNEQIGGFL